MWVVEERGCVAGLVVKIQETVGLSNGSKFSLGKAKVCHMQNLR
jgi:hypothetical protein